MANLYWIDEIHYPEDYSEVKNKLYALNPSIQTHNKCVPFEVISCMIGKPNGQLSREEMVKLSQWYIKDNFKKYKQVYILNKKLFERLRETKNIESIEPKVLNNLPFDSFYIDAESCDFYIDSKIPVNGMFVNIEKISQNGKNYNFLYCVLRIDNKAFYPLCIDLDKDKTSIVSSFDEHFGKSIEKLQKMKKVFVDFMQVILYMCCERKDIVKLIKKPRKKGKYRQKAITYNQLGFKIGKEILEEERRANSEFVIGKTFSDVSIRYSYASPPEEKVTDEEKISRPKAPHFRAAHWAIYHVGKGREQTILKWINTIYVNGDKTDNMPITLHDMR